VIRWFSPKLSTTFRLSYWTGKKVFLCVGRMC